MGAMLGYEDRGNLLQKLEKWHTHHRRPPYILHPPPIELLFGSLRRRQGRRHQLCRRRHGLHRRRRRHGRDELLLGPLLRLLPLLELRHQRPRARPHSRRRRLQVLLHVFHGPQARPGLPSLRRPPPPPRPQRLLLKTNLGLLLLLFHFKSLEESQRNHRKATPFDLGRGFLLPGVQKISAKPLKGAGFRSGSGSFFVSFSRVFFFPLLLFSPSIPQT